MRRFGGLHPFCFGSYSIVERLQNTYLQNLGTAYDAADGYVRIEANAAARELAQVWADVQRARNATQPASTNFLDSWEAAFGITGGAQLPAQQRNVNLQLAWLSLNLPATLNNLLNQMNKIFTISANNGLAQVALFKAYQITTPAQSQSDGTASIPGGGGASGGVSYTSGPWMSAAAHVAIELNYNSTGTAQGTGDIQTLVDQAYAYLDAVLPAWIQFTFVSQTFTTDTGPATNVDWGKLG